MSHFFKMANNERLPILGQFDTEMTWQGVTKMVTILVIDSGEKDINNLISYKTMRDFNVDFNSIQRIVTLHHSANTA